MRTKLFLSILAAALTFGPAVQSVRAWDTEPDAEGLYDKFYDRPTHFPEWEQPNTWANVMYVLCDVREEGADGKRVESYEIAVYDQNDALRHCGRSLAKQDHYCVLTIPGEDGVDTFRFQVLYGADFANPTVADIEGVLLNFKTNASIGTKDEPFLLIVPAAEPTGWKPTSDPSLKGREKILRDGVLYILRDGRMYNAQGGEIKVER